MRSRLLQCTFTLLLFSAWGCREDLCRGEPASFELGLTVADSSLARRTSTIELILRAGEDQGWRHVISAGDDLQDQSTAFSIVLDPAPTGPYTLVLQATLLDLAGRSLATGRLETPATADGCNRFALALGPTGVDGGVDDRGLLDGAEIVDAGDAGMDAAADAGLDGGADAETDSGVSDVGVLSFPYPPSNFDPTTLTPLQGLIVNTSPCVLTFDSSGPTPGFTNACGLPNLPTGVIVTSAGVELVVIPLTRLQINMGSRFLLVGARPVALAVYGEVIIAGVLDASANAQSPGPGGSSPGLCNQGDGDSQQGASSAKAGGGGGGFGQAGALGGHDGTGANRGLGGLPEPTSGLVPLRGGCSGGDGGGGARGGRGGGGLQLSAAGELRTLFAGQILAGGGGGPGGPELEGAGGGGGGGGILLEAARLELAGSILANGGGGGGGGGTGDHGDGGRNGDRMNPSGGGGGPISGGDGGRGTGPTDNPVDGEPASAGSSAGGGGGGGGGGVILLRAVSGCTRSGLSQPAPSPPSAC